MFTIEIAPKAAKQISKLQETEKLAIKNYLKEKVSVAKDKKGLYDIGGTELVGNLKGLWRFKDASFRKYRIIGYLEDEKFYITVLAVKADLILIKIKKNLQKELEKAI